MFTGWLQPLRDLPIKLNLIYLSLRACSLALFLSLSLFVFVCFVYDVFYFHETVPFVFRAFVSSFAFILFRFIWFASIQPCEDYLHIAFGITKITFFFFHVKRIRNAKIKSQLFMSRNQRIESANIFHANTFSPRRCWSIVIYSLRTRPPNYRTK